MSDFGFQSSYLPPGVRSSRSTGVSPVERALTGIRLSELANVLGVPSGLASNVGSETSLRALAELHLSLDLHRRSEDCQSRHARGCTCVESYVLSESRRRRRALDCYENHDPDCDCGGVGDGSHGAYPESIAQTPQPHDTGLRGLNPYVRIRRALAGCGTTWIRGACDRENHEYQMRLFCGREYCRVCGGKDGPSHRRRMARWFPRARKILIMGYLVITIPPEIRSGYRDGASLSRFASRVVRLLKEMGFSRGLRGWDFFGETVNGAAPQYHPHLNLLVDGGWMSEAVLARLRIGVARILGVAENRVNLHWQFSDDVRRKAHWVRYVSRPTFTYLGWDRPLAEQLVGFRNYVAWGGAGAWEGEDAWGDIQSDVGDIPCREVEALVSGLCPFDGGAVTWRSGVVRCDPTSSMWVDVGGDSISGYRLFVGPSPPSRGGGAVPETVARRLIESHYTRTG